MYNLKNTLNLKLLLILHNYTLHDRVTFAHLDNLSNTTFPRYTKLAGKFIIVLFLLDKTYVLTEKKLIKKKSDIFLIISTVHPLIPTPARYLI